MIQPLGNRVLIEPVKQAEAVLSAGGIVLGEDKAPQSVKAKVLAIGPEVTTVKVGDIIYVAQFSPTECRDKPDEKTLICPVEDIMAIEANASEKPATQSK